MKWNKLLTIGRNMFAIGITGLGILCFINKDFILGRPPAWPASVNINPALAYLSGAIVILSAIAILLNKKANIAALIIGLLVLLLSVTRHIPQFKFELPNGYKAIALFGGSLIVAASFYLNKKSAKYMLWAGILSLSAFFIASGYAHFKFDAFVKQFIPSYIPFHSFFTYFTAVCLFAGGIGIIIPFIRKWAALLSGIMLAGWFILLHIPKFLADTNNASDRMGLCESCTFAGIFFVLASVSKSMEKLKQRNEINFR